MSDAPRLTQEPPPKELGVRVEIFDYMSLGVLLDKYGDDAIDRALAEIRASKKARADG